MNSVSDEIIALAAEVIGTAGLEEEEIERRVRGLVDDDMTARRLIDWIPEAFGMVMALHISLKITLPTKFSAKSRNGKWLRFALTDEPIFNSALRLAEKMHHEGPRETFLNISGRSSLILTIDKALNEGVSVEGARFSGPALIGIPAEIYPAPPKSFWQRLFSR